MVLNDHYARRVYGKIAGCSRQRSKFFIQIVENVKKPCHQPLFAVSYTVDMQDELEFHSKNEDFV